MSRLIAFIAEKRRVAAMALAMLVLALMSVTIPAFSGDGGSLMAQTSDALDRYLGRSPGERSETDLLKGKASKGPSLTDRLLGRRGNGGGEPEQRALGKIFDTPPEASLGEMAGVPGPIDLAAPPPSDLLPLGSVGGAPGGVGMPGTPGGIGGILPPPTSTTPVEPVPPGTETPVAPVPEPATWAMMLIGFGLCAAAMRRRRKNPAESTLRTA
jgi:hypothetical protein